MDRQAKAAADFAAKWASVGDEKQDSQRFWIELLQKVYGIDDPASFVRFEQRVKLSHVSYIDVVIPATHTIIEQKSLGKALDAPIKQSDGTFLKPFEQAQRYASHLPYSERPRWIVSCNFSDFLVYDMEHPNAEPQHIALADLGKEYYRLAFLVDVADSHVQKELDLSRAAGTLVGKIYNALLPAYGAQPTAKDLQDLNKFIVRLVFCFYAEDAGLFGPHNAFQRCMETFRAENFRLALITLFRVLDQKEDERDRFLDPKFAVFPYCKRRGYSGAHETGKPHSRERMQNCSANFPCRGSVAVGSGNGRNQPQRTCKSQESYGGRRDGSDTRHVARRNRRLDREFCGGSTSGKRCRLRWRGGSRRTRLFAQSILFAANESTHGRLHNQNT